MYKYMRIINLLKKRRNGLTVDQLMKLTGFSEKQVRNGIDTARRKGYDIENIGPETFKLHP